MRVPMPRVAAVLLLAAVVSACGASPSPVPAGSAGSSAAPSGSGAVTLKPGPVDPSTIAAWRPQVALNPQAISDKMAELEASLTKLVDAEGTYGPIATEQQAALQQAEGQALAKLRDDLQTKLGGGAAVPNAALTAYREHVGGAIIRPGQGLLAGGWFVLLMMSLFTVGSYDPKAGDVPEVSISDSLNSSSEHGSMSGDATMTLSVTGGIVTAKLTLTGSLTGISTDTGRSVTTSGQSTYAFTINPCPDQGGGVVGTVDLTDQETTTSPGRMTLGWNITGHTDYHAQISDQAETASIAIQTKIDEQLTRTITQAHESDVAYSENLTTDGGGSPQPGQDTMTLDNVSGDGVTGDQGQIAVAMMHLFGVTTPIILVSTAADVWKGGKCFEVRPDPKSADVDPGSQTQVKVAVYHWVDKADVQLPVRATLSGPKQIDPFGQPVTSPATFTYTAGSPDTTGTVEFKVVSKRGIASATGTYHARGDLTVKLTGTLMMNAAGIWIFNLRIAGSDIQLTAAQDGSISASGQVTVKGTATAPIGACTATVNEKIGVQARGRLQGPPDAQVWHVQIGPTSENNLGEKISCPGITLPSNEGDYFGQWSATIGYVDLPAAGGTVAVHGSTSGLLDRQATGTIMATTH
jgi:hypothetical protein